MLNVSVFSSVTLFRNNFPSLEQESIAVVYAAKAIAVYLFFSVKNISQGGVLFIIVLPMLVGFKSSKEKSLTVCVNQNVAGITTGNYLF